MNLITDKSLQSKFSDDVLGLIASKKAHKASGNQDGEESVSYLLTTLRQDKGWKIPGNPGDFEDTLTAAGFTLRESFAGRSRRVYVTI